MKELFWVIPFVLAFLAPTFTGMAWGDLEFRVLDPRANFYMYSTLTVGIAGGMVFAAQVFQRGLRWWKLPIACVLAGLGAGMGWLMGFALTADEGTKILARYAIPELVLGYLILGFVAMIATILVRPDIPGSPLDPRTA